MAEGATHARLGDVCVLGVGRTAEALAGYLLAQVPGRVRSLAVFGGRDSRPGPLTERLGAAGVRVVLGCDEVTGSFDLAITSPGIPLGSAFAQSARACSRELVGEPEFAWRESPERWVAITGTNGKTTTTSLATSILQAGGLDAVSVGNIGNVCIGEVPNRPAGEWFVAELSSFQLATTSRLHPRVACLLNISPDHLEWHGSMEAYAQAKERVFRNLGENDLAIVGVEDSYCRAVAERLGRRGLRVLAVDVHATPKGSCAAFLRGDMLVVRLDGHEYELAPRDGLSLAGEHNLQNCLAASAIGLELGVSPDAITRALASFSPLEHRIEPAGTVSGVRFINDSKATNTDAVEKALTAFPTGRIVLMLGGHDKGTDLSSLARAVCERCRVAVCYGAAGGRIAAALEAAREDADAPLGVVRARHLEDAFQAAVARAHPGDVVLLSPACSSFDEFSNMAERGRAFKALVAALPGA